MRAEIFSHEKLIGTTELSLGDESMGCLYGSFSPTENYNKHVKKAIQEFWSTNKTDYAKWKSLEINVQLENGYFIFATGGFTIDDIHELPDEPKRIDIMGIDRHVIEDFFLEKEPRSFIEEPWAAISIEQKLAFEKELKIELGIYHNKSFLDFFNSKKKRHILADFEISALCQDQRNDNVLFITRKSKYNKDFAVVHLTWKGSKEFKGYPMLEFYEDFDEFKYKRMYPDKVDWEY